MCNAEEVKVMSLLKKLELREKLRPIASDLIKTHYRSQRSDKKDE